MISTKDNLFIPDKEIAQLILDSKPDFTLFYSWYKITDVRVPERPNLQTNEDYLKENWQKLKYRAKKALEEA